mmetsp:Transcript_9130/g.24065  ORF Transcript_9130/g.24065 Transcript_9130/m.24065 type:complete len:732 (+) Transcript_9130:125-2320(+)
MAPVYDDGERWAEQHTNHMSTALQDLLSKAQSAVSSVKDADESLFGPGDAALQLLAHVERRTRAKCFSVCVVGMMKTGKSTFLNNLLECPLYPEDVLPETAAVISTLHDDAAEQPSLYTARDGTLLAVGTERVYSRVRELNTQIRGGAGIDTQYKLRARVPRLRDRLSGVNLEIFDTPGANEANEVVEVTAREVIERADVLVIILDITRIGTLDDERYLSQLVRLRPDMLMDRRIFILLNKADRVRYNPNTIRDATERVRGFLQRIDPALAAFEIRALSSMDYAFGSEGLRDAVSPEHAEDFHTALFGRQEPRPLSEMTDELNTLVMHSRYLEVERAVLDRLTLRAPRLFAQAMLGAIQGPCRVLLAEHLAPAIAAREASAQIGDAMLAALRRVHDGCSGIVEHCRAKIRQEQNMLDAQLQNVKMQMDAVARDVRISQAGAQAGMLEFDTVEQARSTADSLINATAAKFRRDTSECETQFVLRLHEFFSFVQAQCDEACNRELRQLLRTELSEAQFNLSGALSEYISTLDNLPAWSRPDIPRTNNGDVSVDFDGAIGAEARNVVRQEPVLIPAIMGEEIHETTSGGGSAGWVQDLIFGKKSKKKTRFVRQIVVQEARIEKQNVDVEVERHCVRLETLRETAITSFLAYNATRVQMLQNAHDEVVASSTDGIQQVLDRRVDGMIETIRREIDERSRNAQAAQAKLAELLALHGELQAVITETSKTPEEAMNP